MQFDIEFTLTKNEVRDASFISMAHFRTFQLATAGLLVIAIVQMATGAIAAAFTLLMASVVMGVVLAYMSTRTWQEAPALQDKQHMMFSDDSFDHVATAGESSLKWTNFSKIVESKQFFILRFHQKMIVVVPKRAMTSDQVVTFSRFANQGLYLL